MITGYFSGSLVKSIHPTEFSIQMTNRVNAPAGVIVIDRVDNQGHMTPSASEYISHTGIKNGVLQGITRGAYGSTAQSHPAGAQIEYCPAQVLGFDYPDGYPKRDQVQLEDFLNYL